MTDFYAQAVAPREARVPTPVAPLFVPANRPERFSKAAASGADAVIIDIEDAVPPGAKAAAREALGAGMALGLPTFFRVNAEGTEWHEADCWAIRRLAAPLVCVPKAESGDMLDRIAARLGGRVTILAQIETARGVANAEAIAAHPLVSQLAFGPADFFLDMNMRPSPPMSAHVLARLAIASRLAGKPGPLDGPCFAVGDDAAIERECAAAIAHGAGGKLCIHPTQPGRVFSAFLPGETEIEWAAEVVAAAGDGGARLVKGHMVDAPILARARAILAGAGRSRGEENNR